MASAISPSSMLAIGTAMPALGLIAVCARFYVRLYYKQGLRADDWLILPALTMVIASGILIIIAEQQGILGYTAGTQDFDFLNWALVWLLELEYAFNVINILNVTFVKLSILYFYRRVFVTGQNRRFDIFTKVFAGILVIWAVALILMSIFFCGTNFSLNWNSTYNQFTASCGNPAAANMSWVVTDLVLDMILLVIPIPLIKRLQLSSGRRVGIVFVFTLGSLAIVGSILRVVIFAFIYSGTGFDFLSDDFFVATAVTFYWSIFEGGLGVIVSCLPVLQIFFRKTSVGQVAKNVLGIFSVKSLSRTFQRSASRGGSTKDVNSSGSNLHKTGNSLELDKTSEHRHDAEQLYLWK